MSRHDLSSQLGISRANGYNSSRFLEVLTIRLTAMGFHICTKEGFFPFLKGGRGPSTRESGLGSLRSRGLSWQAGWPSAGLASRLEVTQLANGTYRLDTTVVGKSYRLTLINNQGWLLTAASTLGPNIGPNIVLGTVKPRPPPPPPPG